MISPLAYVDPEAKLGKNVTGSIVCTAGLLERTNLTGFRLL